MRTIPDESCTENQNTFYVQCLFSGSRAIYEIMGKNTVDQGRPQMTICRMRISRWVPKATNTHSQYVILIPFPRQQWWHERDSMLRYTYMYLNLW